MLGGGLEYFHPERTDMKNALFIGPTDSYPYFIYYRFGSEGNTSTSLKLLKYDVIQLILIAILYSQATLTKQSNAT